MLIRSLPLQEIISVSQTPAEIITVLSRRGISDGSADTILYKIYVTVDVDAAIQRNAYNLQVKAREKNDEKSVIPSRVVSASKWNKATKSLERNVRTLSLAAFNEVIASRTIDITQFISNDLANLIPGSTPTRVQLNSLAARSSIVALNDPFTLSEPLITRPSTPGVVSSPSPVVNRDRSFRAPSTTVSQGNRTATFSPSSFSRTAISQKIDPAAVTVSSIKGLGNTMPSPLLTDAINMVLSPSTTLPTMPTFRVVSRKETISFTIQVKKNRMTKASSFQLEMELEDSNGVKVDDLTVEIPHAKIYNTYITPRSAPSLEAEYIKPGTVSVRVAAPKDKKAKTLKVFRRTSAPVSGGTDFGTQWIEVFKSSVNDSNENVFKDQIATSRPVMYRAVVYGENFKPSEKFSSTVVLPISEFKALQTGSLTAIPELGFKGRNTFTKVTVKDIPDDVVTVMVRRFNLTNSSISERKASRGSGFVYIGSSPNRQTVSTEDIGSDGAVTFRDNTAKSGKAYSYVPVGITKSGKQILGSSAVMEIPLSPSRAQVSIDVGSPKTISSSAESLEVEFSLSARFTDFGFSEVRKSLSAGSQKELFDRNLLEDRDKFEKLISFLVERRNSKTGEEESFGVVTGEVFSDSPQSRSRSNVKNLVPGDEYTYTFTALLSTPETLFPQLSRKEVDVGTLLTFSRKVAKFQNNLALVKSTLKSTSRQKDFTKPSPLEPNDPLVAGRTNVQQTVEFRAPTVVSNRRTFRVEKYRGFNRLVWYTENVDKIDHFKIFVASSGGKVLIDTIHCDDSSSEFYYRHYHKDYGVNFRYVVEPVDLSYKSMSVIQSDTIKAADVARSLGVFPTDLKVKRL